MTCIVGIKAEDGVWLGADSCSGNVSNYNVDVAATSKILMKNIAGKPALIGCTSSWRMIDIIENCNFNKIKKGKSDRQTLFRFISRLSAKFSQHGFRREKDSEQFGGTFLIAFNRSLYTVQDDFSVVESTRNYAACGCGESYALGALSTAESYCSDLEPASVIHAALAAASEHSAYVCEPFKYWLLEK